MKAKNLILADCAFPEIADFKSELVNATGEEWDVWICRSNKGRAKRLYEAYRYIQFFLFPFRVLLRRKKYAGGEIVAWQQFYGVLFAVYARLFRCKKVNKLTIMTFIYKPKKGIVGKAYFKLARYALQSGHIDHVTCTARAETEMYAKLFNVSPSLFSFVPWGVMDNTETAQEDESLTGRKYAFSPGRSNRDWDFLIDNLKEGEYPLLIACDQLQGRKIGNVEIRDDIGGPEVHRYMKNAFCVVISIDDPDISAGQTVLLHAFNFGKPLIITRSKGLTDDYVTDRHNALIIDKTKSALIQALDELHQDKELYARLSQNGIRDFYSLYTKSALGRNIAAVIMESRNNNDVPMKTL